MANQWMEQGYHPNQQPIQPARSAPAAPAYRQPIPQPIQQPQPAPQPVYAAPAVRESYFDGGILSFLGLAIVNFFIIVCTLGICYPWAACRSCRWEQQHTVLDGHRLVFDGTALELFGLWIKNWFLILITLGIYGLWAGRSVKRWVVRHTHLA